MTTLEPTPRSELVGRTIGGKYRVRGVLGRGGMGTVLDAEQVGIGRPVAIKLLHRDRLRQPLSIQRFQKEARAAGAIGHPNICEVYDSGLLEDDGCPYFVMERLVGETFARRIAVAETVPVDEAVDVLCQVLSGLAAAHAKGIIHRDIKPQNVFITRPVGYASVVKLLDFGISMLPAAPTSEGGADIATAPGTVVGTPHYMAPEQAGGERDLDARADLYPCGVMLYEALTGRLPYTAPSYHALLIQMLTTKPPPARELRPDLPDAVEPILERALSPARESRYASASEFLDDLRALREGNSDVPEADPTVRDLSPFDTEGEDEGSS